MSMQKLLKILMPAYNVLFWKQDTWTFGLWNGAYSLYQHCVFVWKFSWLLIMEFTNESVYWHGRCRNSNCLNSLPQKVLACAPDTCHLSAQLSPPQPPYQPQNNTTYRLKTLCKCKIIAPQAAWSTFCSQHGSVAIGKVCYCW